MKEELLRLADLCEKATEPDRDLDHAIWDAVRGEDNDGALLFTTSLDAAMTLVDDKQASGILHEAWSRLSDAHALHARFWKAEDGDYRQCLARFVTAAALRASVKEQNNGK